MRMPGFVAETSLYKSISGYIYSFDGTRDNQGMFIMSQQLSTFDPVRIPKMQPQTIPLVELMRWLPIIERTCGMRCSLEHMNCVEECNDQAVRCVQERELELITCYQQCSELPYFAGESCMRDCRRNVCGVIDSRECELMCAQRIDSCAKNCKWKSFQSF